MSELFRVGDVPMKFMTVAEFCKEVRISTSHFKAMEAAGTAPRTLCLGLGIKKRKNIRITRQDALKWVEDFNEVKAFP